MRGCVSTDTSQASSHRERSLRERVRVKCASVRGGFPALQRGLHSTYLYPRTRSPGNELSTTIFHNIQSIRKQILTLYVTRGTRC